MVFPLYVFYLYLMCVHILYNEISLAHTIDKRNVRAVFVYMVSVLFSVWCVFSRCTIV